jgi:putative acetyltransferase
MHKPNLLWSGCREELSGSVTSAQTLNGARPHRPILALSNMSEPVHIRRYAPGEEAPLFDVYFTAIHLVASHDYSAEQIEAWAPRSLDMAIWQKKIREIRPFVAVLNGELVGYADVQPTGYIDHFFVSGNHPRRGIGSLLMTRIVEEARSLSIPVLTSDVSRTAQPFFARFGFAIVEQRHPEVRGIVIPNALMSRHME